MPQTNVLARLDSILELTEAFSPVFFEVSALRRTIASEALIAADPWNDPNFVEDRFQEWLDGRAAVGC